MFDYISGFNIGQDNNNFEREIVNIVITHQF